MTDLRNSDTEEHSARTPFAIAACLHVALRWIFRRSAVLPAVDWRQTVAAVCIRFLRGLRWAIAVCMFLVPVFFCPWPQSRSSLYTLAGKVDWILWVSLGVVTGMGLVFALTTRAKLREPGDIFSFVESMEMGEGLEDSSKTGCLGILLPLAVTAYAVYNFTHSGRLSFLFHQPLNSDTIIRFGIFGMGIAFVLHALGFVPYQRVPFLKYVLAAVGVALFMYGASWQPGVR